MKLEFETNSSTRSFVGNSAAENTGSAERGADVSQMLQAGIKAAQEGNRAEARQLLVQVTEAEPENENAWLWMASISEYPEELLVFLNNVLEVNPNNVRALEWSQATHSMLAKSFVQRGVDASNEANMELAKQCFLQAIVHDNQNEMAWLWMASISDSTEEKIAHLQKVLAINPKNETAHASLQAAKNQISESLLQKANRAAISGDRAEANEMLQTVLQQNPELEEAWILKSYLADSFSEKVTAYEKVLSLNPDNDAANSGLASLKAMMAKTETRKAEQLERVAELMQARESVENASAETEPVRADAATEFSAHTAESNYSTGELKFPSDHVQPADAQFETFQNDGQSETEERGYFQPSEPTEQPQNFDADSFSHRTISAQPPVEENYAAESNAAETENAAGLVERNDSFAERENFSVQEDFSAQENVSAQEESFSIQTEEVAGENKPHSKPLSEMFACSFCDAENEANAFVCGSCRTVLTLSDLEMLLANAETDVEAVSRTVGRMESEMTQRDFEPHELKTLALGHINLKNLRQGILHLQAALRMTPNDVMLGSQVNSLKIRLHEIELQESNHNLQTRGRKIMVVDDSATVRKLISGKLEKSGHEVFCAVDGVDALEQIKQFVPDLILLDIMMPQMDGYQVCKYIRSNEATRNVPIVMISGKDGFFDKVRGRMSGTTGYITKPFGPETLMKTIESYII